MNELYKKSIKTLELSAVLSMLGAGSGVRFLELESAVSLQVLSDKERIRRLLTKCTDAKRLVGLYGSPAFTAVKECGPTGLKGRKWAAASA
jgi:hypothetical protein